jgi:catechol 2,3-dioxygenase-like lactoylglutathione lyase family enzyme
VFDHVHLRVTNLAESKRFYATVLAPLGFASTTDRPDLVEFGALSLSAEEPRTQAIHLAREPDRIRWEA